MITPTRPSEQLLFSTVRIETQTAAGDIGVGTGFRFDLPGVGDQVIPLIVTNKHVVAGADVGRLNFHEADLTGGTATPSGRFFPIELDRFESHWVFHSDDNVDLCAMFFKPLQLQAQKLGKTIFSRSMGSMHIVADSDLPLLNAVEDVLMIGYPIGLWDQSNNLPLIRRGITASHPAIDFCGDSVMVVDVACFPGSSGSPVVIVNEEDPIYRDRILLLGVLFAGPVLTAEGEIVTRTIPTSRQVSRTNLMIHLGYTIKAKEILVVGEQIKTLLQATGIRPLSTP